jgi:predicted Zn-dependent protease
LLEPKNAEAQLELARAMVANGEFSDAEAQLGSLSKIQPRNPAVYGLLARAYSGLGKKRDAERAQRRASDLKARPTKSVTKIRKSDATSKFFFETGDRKL